MTHTSLAVCAAFMLVGCSSASPTNAEPSTSLPDAGETSDARGTSGGACDPTFGPARYEVDLEATWSAATHPMAFVPGAHLTPLTGGSHNANLIVWRVGGKARRGVEAVAGAGDPQLAALRLHRGVQSRAAG